MNYPPRHYIPDALEELTAAVQENRNPVLSVDQMKALYLFSNWSHKWVQKLDRPQNFKYAVSFDVELERQFEAVRTSQDPDAAMIGLMIWYEEQESRVAPGCGHSSSLTNPMEEDEE